MAFTQIKDFGGTTLRALGPYNISRKSYGHTRLADTKGKVKICPPPSDFGS